MTTRLECRLAVLGLDFDWAQAAISAIPDFVRDHLSYASHGDIDLSVASPVLLPDAGAVGGSVSALQLHTQLLTLNANSLNGPLKRIGILFAHSYAGLPGAYGIMFDRGFATSDDPNDAPIFTARPRQGCAVFLGQIATGRPDPSQFADEVKFTTVHELGHVFNLQHDATELNFMKTSDPDHAYGPAAYRFTPFQQHRLEVCDHDSSVMPGGSKFDADGATNRPTRPVRAGPSNLRLSIHLSRTRFFRFEPIQLEIELSLGKGERPVAVPAIVDPSHDRFRLMIENDRGERALYLPPYRVCGGSDTLKISGDNGYRRDFPIFGQAGGYTFRRAGRHVIWAEMDVLGGRLRSNKLNIEVQTEVGLSAAEREFRAVLSGPLVGQLLYHREDPGDLIALHKLSRYVQRESSVPSAGEINYTLARAVLKTHQPLRDVRDQARRWIEQALKSEDLGSHQKERALHLGQALEEGVAKGAAQSRRITPDKRRGTAHRG